MKLVYQIDLHKPIRCIDCSVVNEEQQKEGGQQVNSQDGQVAQRYRIDESKIDKQKSNDQSTSKPLFMILTSSKTYLIEGSFVKETREWIKAIKNARGNIQEQEEDLKKRRTVTKKLINGETTTELMEDKFNKSFSEENLIQQGQQQSYDEYDEQDDGLNQSEEDRKADEALEIIPPKDPILWERHLSHMGIDWLNVKSFKTEDQKQEKEKIKELRPLDSNKSENENEETIQEDKTILEQEHKLRQIIQSSFSEVKQESTILSLSEFDEKEETDENSQQQQNQEKGIERKILSPVKIYNNINNNNQQNQSSQDNQQNDNSTNSTDGNRKLGLLIAIGVLLFLAYRYIYKKKQ